jgi:hypothetical protein
MRICTTVGGWPVAFNRWQNTAPWVQLQNVAMNALLEIALKQSTSNHGRWLQLEKKDSLHKLLTEDIYLFSSYFTATLCSVELKMYNEF